MLTVADYAAGERVECVASYNGMKWRIGRRGTVVPSTEADPDMNSMFKGHIFVYIDGRGAYWMAPYEIRKVSLLEQIAEAAQ